jgi:hypothetical protein
VSPAEWVSWVGLAALPLGPLAGTVVNLATWRVPGGGPVAGTVSALVPARNEEGTIERCVSALLAEPVHEVLVLDDGSTDGTGAILQRLAAQHPRLRVLHGAPLPPGWVGKVHACHQLARAATGEHLLFVDADTRLLPGAVAALRGVPADVVTAFPGQELGTVGEALIVSLLHLTYTSWLPLALIPRTRAPSVLAANGQVLLVRRAAYDALGGFESVRGAIVDDMAFCRRAKEQGLVVSFVPGDGLATCRMYDSGSAAWRGFSKNLVPGLGHPIVVAVVAVLYTACFVLPWLLAPLAPLPALVGITANLTQRALLAARFRLPASTVALHLPSALAFLGVLATSARWTAAGTLHWRGRTYPASGGAA